MKRVVAFLTAFALFVATVVSVHVLFADYLDFHNPKFGTWINDKKFAFGEAITKNLDKDSIVVFGSSELAHGRGTKYHPERMFKNKDLHMMMIGAGYYQCLSHAVTLSAIAPEIKNKKVVLILSPQWFRKKGVLANAYASRFSESSYISMLRNQTLSPQTKDYIVKRTLRLLRKDPPTLKRVKSYNRIFLTKTSTAKDRLFFRFYYPFLQERSRISVVTQASAMGIKHLKANQVIDRPSRINWKAYLKDAEADGERETKSNDFYMKDILFHLRVAPKMAKKKDAHPHGSYAVSPEYDDLKCFLDVCKEEGIEPLLVSIPVNGWWYDYVAFPKEGREDYYENIRKIAKEYDVKLADFSGDEYTKYFLEDSMHLGWKGWVYVNESIYNFAKEN